MVPDTAALRANMVATQLRTNDVTDARICNAMLTIPRERFVPQAWQAVAYMDGIIPLAGGRALPDARSFGKLLQLAAIAPGDVVLDVGCATGYSSAVLSLLAGRVFALEENLELARVAEDNLRALGAANVSIVRGTLVQGCPQYAPFDAIVLNGACEIDPVGLLAQLRDGGRLVAIKRNGAAGSGCLYLNHAGAIGERNAFDAQLPVLPGFEKPKSFVF